MMTTAADASRDSAPTASVAAPSVGGDAPVYDVVVVGGGPAGATAAEALAREGARVLLLDRAGRIKPCGGAVPPRLIRDFGIPDSLMVAKARGAQIIAPSGRVVDMPIEGGYVGMVDRDVFDEWLRERARACGAERERGVFQRIERDGAREGLADVVYRAPAGDDGAPEIRRARTRFVIGADGARSSVARDSLADVADAPYVIAYHEIIRSPEDGDDTASSGFKSTRCDVVYDGDISPDFYGWVFPHGPHTSVGMGTADRNVSLRDATKALRAARGLTDQETIREEGAPIPMKPLKRWDNRRDVVLAGDAAGVVAPASGEGIYYAMLGGQLAADAVAEALATGDARALATARRRFMRDHGRVFWILGMMQKFWYCSDRRRERFVSMCADRDVQRLTWEAYMNKRLVKSDPGAHLRIFLKDMAHLLGLVRPT